tara:strand:+ start:720 stop:1301 length:582 start_codon:yes stop_codon:yes gene_type:complete
MGKKNEKRILEFDSIDEVLEFLKKHENIKIQVSRMIEYNGFYQLLDDKKDEAGHTLEEIKNIAEAEGYDLWGDSPDEDYDLNKPVYEASAGIEQWANGYTSKATLIKILEKAKESTWWPEYDDEELSQIDTFIVNSVAPGLPAAYEPDDWMKYFEAFDFKSGLRNRKGKKISWWGITYTQCEEWDITLITDKP